MTMDIVRRYVEAWNEHDEGSLLSVFTDDGTYQDSSTGTNKLSGEALGNFAKNLWNSFPDLYFEVEKIMVQEDGSAVMEWIMHGSNTGSFAGMPPTGRKISIEGVDVFSIQNNKIYTVKGYYDTNLFSQQLGLDVIVQPHTMGSFTFGTALKASSDKRTKPGVFTLTWLDLKSDDDVSAFEKLSVEMIEEALEMEGFVGFTGATIDNRQMTFTMWDDLENAMKFNYSKTHRESMRNFFQANGYAQSIFTSIWVPYKLNPMWVRCTVCKKVSDFDLNQGKCACGQALPEPPTYF
jgi:steroid delta-isomerase-like uncharacterized protein